MELAKEEVAIADLRLPIHRIPGLTGDVDIAPVTNGNVESFGVAVRGAPQPGPQATSFVVVARDGCAVDARIRLAMHVTGRLPDNVDVRERVDSHSTTNIIADGAPDARPVALFDGVGG